MSDTLKPPPNIQDYSDKSFAVYGDTKPLKEVLKKLGGKFNPNLKGGPGWIFSMKHKENVKLLLH